MSATEVILNNAGAYNDTPEDDFSIGAWNEGNSTAYTNNKS
jgi:hypothetical protein